MELTQSYTRVLPKILLPRFRFAEVRNAAAVLKASDPGLFKEVTAVLQAFYIEDDYILTKGGNRGPLVKRLDGDFENLGWSAVRVDTEFKLVGKKKTNRNSKKANYNQEYFPDVSIINPGYEVDNMKRRVALDIEWNSKDGNLDRDFSSYRFLYEQALIDVGILIVREFAGIRDLIRQEQFGAEADRRLGTHTVASLENAIPRLRRGDGGGCPILVVAMTRSTWQGYKP